MTQILKENDTKLKFVSDLGLILFDGRGVQDLR